ncbi:MAG: M48 family metalloprotease [Fervidobacterium sp.]|nr:M48 family metalloprotease [Fervidobacterium sp.]
MKIKIHENIIKLSRETVNKISMYVVLGIFISFSLLFGFLLDLLFKTNGLFSILFLIFSLLQTLFGMSIVGRVIINLLEAQPVNLFNKGDLRVDLKVIEELFKNTSSQIDLKEDIELFLVDSQTINAISIGRLKHDHKICITIGALEKLEYGELKALFYHEIFHIINGDTDYLTTVSGSFGSPMLFFTISNRNLKRLLKNKNKLSNTEFYKNFFILWFISIASFILLPLSLLTNIFVSVKKEFDADVFASKNTSLDEMIKLFEKVKLNCKSFEVNYYFMKHLFFTHPNCKDVSKRPNRIIETYPSIDERIEFLKNLENQ